jgi:hypothetical protein
MSTRKRSLTMAAAAAGDEMKDVPEPAGQGGRRTIIRGRSASGAPPASAPPEAPAVLSRLLSASWAEVWKAMRRLRVPAMLSPVDYGKDDKKTFWEVEPQSAWTLAKRGACMTALVKLEPLRVRSIDQTKFFDDLRDPAIQSSIQWGPDSQELAPMLQGEVAMTPETPTFLNTLVTQLVSIAAAEESLYGIYTTTANRTPRMARTGPLGTKYGPGADTILGEILALFEQYVMFCVACTRDFVFNSRSFLDHTWWCVSLVSSFFKNVATEFGFSCAQALLFVRVYFDRWMNAHADSGTRTAEVSDRGELDGDEFVLLLKMFGQLELRQKAPTPPRTKLRRLSVPAAAALSEAREAGDVDLTGAHVTLRHTPMIVMSPKAAGRDGNIHHRGGPSADAGSVTCVADVVFHGEQPTALQVLQMARLALELFWQSTALQLLLQRATDDLVLQTLPKIFEQPEGLMVWHDFLRCSLKGQKGGTSSVLSWGITRCSDGVIRAP